MNDYDSTFDYQLTKYGIKYFNNRYIGTFSSDEIPTLNNYECCIINTDDSSQPGSHWIALIRWDNNSEDNNIYFYDSFGRRSYVLSDNFNKNWTHSNPNREQDYNNETCGQFCLAWLMTVYELTPRVVSKYI